ncbi:MAG: glycosyltransferase family 4 protein [Patescibacteria group bacterium]
MRAGIYNPYLDTLGGGERYIASVAKVLVDAGYTVDLYWEDSAIKERMIERFGLDLSAVNIVPDIKRGDGYDVCFWVSDGSIPTLLARKNFLHFQVPFQKVNGNTLLNKMKLFRINKIICNSNFTKKIIDKEFGVLSEVLYPPVDVAKFKPGKKENTILYIGRFSDLLQKKRQDILIKAFKKFFDSGFKDYKLILAGGSDVGVNKFVEKLSKISKGYPIKIFKSPNFNDLRKLYSSAKIFWSASGYGVDEAKEPKEVEHFGITVVEAMAAGALPIVFYGGGHKEIVNDGVNGFLWGTIGALISKTKKIVEDKRLYFKLIKNAKAGSQKYSYERFEKEFLALL